jgi:acyl-coenzyme A synthetase/AMP-(fatty) acid ligase
LLASFLASCSSLSSILGKENGPLIGAMNYEQLIAEGSPTAPWEPPADEWDTLSLCYTSGTTADPKGCGAGKQKP